MELISILQYDNHLTGMPPQNCACKFEQDLDMPGNYSTRHFTCDILPRVMEPFNTDGNPLWNWHKPPPPPWSSHTLSPLTLSPTSWSAHALWAWVSPCNLGPGPIQALVTVNHYAATTHSILPLTSLIKIINSWNNSLTGILGWRLFPWSCKHLSERQPTQNHPTRSS